MPPDGRAYRTLPLRARASAQDPPQIHIDGSIDDWVSGCDLDGGGPINALIVVDAFKIRRLHARSPSALRTDITYPMPLTSTGCTAS
jgi:hypothetical protein